MRTSLRALVAVAALSSLALAPASELLRQDPLAPVLDAVGGCDTLDPTRCLLPFPNDAFTVADDSTETGLRVALPQEGMPRSLGVKPVDVTAEDLDLGPEPKK